MEYDPDKVDEMVLALLANDGGAAFHDNKVWVKKASV